MSEQLAAQGYPLAANCEPWLGQAKLGHWEALNAVEREVGTLVGWGSDLGGGVGDGEAGS